MGVWRGKCKREGAATSIALTSTERFVLRRVCIVSIRRIAFALLRLISDIVGLCVC